MQCSVWTNSAPSHVRKREGLERTCLVGFVPSLLHFFCPLSSTYVMSWQSVLATIGIWTEERLQRFFFNFSNHIKVKLEMCWFPENIDRITMPDANPKKLVSGCIIIITLFIIIIIITNGDPPSSVIILCNAHRLDPHLIAALSCVSNQRHRAQ